MTNKEDLDKIISDLGEDANKSVTWKDLVEFSFEMNKMISEIALKGDETVYQYIDHVIEDYSTKFYFIMSMLYGNTEKWLPVYEKYCNMVKETSKEDKI